jgi:EF-P beta-lysylation protein EpmB
MRLMRDSPSNWQKILATGFSSAKQLLEYLNLNDAKFSNIAEQEFASRIPIGFADLMESSNPNDPLLLQVLAVKDELLVYDDFIKDPLMESNSNIMRGLIHKYHGRVLLTVTGVCAINCRFCFRRHFPYQENNPGRSGWGEVFSYIKNDKSITEVILSGGDPLIATDELLAYLFENIANIAHVETIRIHTRIPIVLPERICDALLSNIKKSRCKFVIVLHCNHPNELSPDVNIAISKLKEVGCVLLNQTVLLKNINDCPDVLVSLNKKLFNFGVLPYYLHLLDKTKGTKHFEVSLDRAKEIYQKIQTLLPGYLVPNLVREEALQLNKSRI